MAEVNSGSESEGMDIDQVIKDFWDTYQEFGMVHAVNFLDTATGGDIKELEGMIPSLMSEAQDRNIDMHGFVKEWEENVARIQAEQTNAEDQACPIGE